MTAELLKDMGKRKGLQRILDDKQGGYNAIIAWHNDRLSRDLTSITGNSKHLKQKKYYELVL